MGMVGQHVGSVSGMLERPAGGSMHHDDATVDRRLVDAVASFVPPAPVVAEAGRGPGGGQAARRNRAAFDVRLLRRVQGDSVALNACRPIGLVVAVHVLSVRPEPVEALEAIWHLLRPGGHVALGYHLERHVPAVARRDFAVEGHRPGEDDDDVAALLPPAGLEAEHLRVPGPVDSALVRLLNASSVS